MNDTRAVCVRTIIVVGRRRYFRFWVETVLTHGGKWGINVRLQSSWTREGSFILFFSEKSGQSRVHLCTSVRVWAVTKYDGNENVWTVLEHEDTFGRIRQRYTVVHVRTVTEHDVNRVNITVYRGNVAVIAIISR